MLMDDIKQDVRKTTQFVLDRRNRTAVEELILFLMCIHIPATLHLHHLMMLEF